MTQKQCFGCQHLQSCTDVYHRLGHVRGPNITPKVLMAFVLPLVVLVLCLWGMHYLLGDHPTPLMTLVSLVVGLLVSFMTVLCCWLIRRKGRHDSG